MAALTNSLVRASRPRLGPSLSVFCVSRRNESTVYKDQTSNLAAYRRGRGGRSSFSGLVTTVFGATGFLGKYVINKLGKIGSQVIVPYRADGYYTKDLKLAGDLGQVLFLPYNLRDEESIRKAMQYSNVVINLVGRDYETKNFTFRDVNVVGPVKLAQIATEMGVEKFIHFSHLNAQPNPPPIVRRHGSRYLATKYEGEMAVREYFPDATVFRPSDMYGPEDRFLRYYVKGWRRTLGNIPLWKRGEQTIKMPVFVSDVAQGVINAILDPEAAGKTIEAVGPESFYLSEIIDYMLRCIRNNHAYRLPLTPDFILKVWLMKIFPNSPPSDLDVLAREHVSDETHYLPTLQDLGVKLTRFEDRAPYELKPFKRHSYYEEILGEFAPPAPPRPIPS